MESSEVQLYSSPGCTSNGDMPGQLQSLNLPGKQPDKSSEKEKIDPSEFSKVIKSDQLRNLHTKQTIMEIFIRRILKSIKSSNEVDQSKTYLKLTKMLEVLFSQKQNLQDQIGVLEKELITLNEKYLNTCKSVDDLTAEHLSLWKDSSQLKRELEKKTTEVENLSHNRSTLLEQLKSYGGIKTDKANREHELNCVQSQNKNLQSVSRQLGTLLRTKTQECENLEFNNIQLQREVQCKQEEKINSRARIEQLMHENKLLKQEITQNRAEQVKSSLSGAEIDKMRGNLQQLQSEYYKLQQLFTKEIETRTLLQNQLQEEYGNLKVFCRCRSSNTSSNPCILQFQSIDRIIVPIDDVHQRQTYVKSANKHTVNENIFTFNRVFRPDAKQLDVFEEIRPLIASCIHGHNVCIMAYGPTGSGKTYTIQGSINDPGIALRTVTGLFELCGPLHIQVSIAMLGIHKEIIYDLLSEKTRRVKLFDDSSDVRLNEVEEKIVDNEQDTIYWIKKGNTRHKSISNTSDIEPARTHYIIRLQITLRNALNKTKRNSSLILCDLAGSESAERNQTKCKVQTEIGSINKSLVSLARVFEALRRRNSSVKSGVHNTSLVTIPYRDSKLTHLLKPCFGGQAKVILIITISDEPNLIDRNLKALEFGQKAMEISLGPTSPNRTILTNWFRKPEVEKS
ncbi:unnamed protein product [Schistosoma turkestanicum]|nr:unnamed protein product [Schistosoma turkestanicum]